MATSAFITLCICLYNHFKSKVLGACLVIIIVCIYSLYHLNLKIVFFSSFFIALFFLFLIAGNHYFDGYIVNMIFILSLFVCISIICNYRRAYIMYYYICYYYTNVTNQVK